ncbi:MerR family transcriptional regulator [Massilia sp. CCM 9210]|uniref:MerR family transcriptional regulator n=1 Tax=Massilia scottii TaxID=3057166 RepID=UPI0027965597|nr:MerR family transcriptional regulator [Massilia sp. CCM 9210]MDQ1814109.1 MerR family transcriptional regulator [Massilia sp. CCM 9210]
MKLKIGELAKRSGLTVRALHHYDSIGLLSPSARSDAGYRLYNRDDIARLHQVQALRRFGVSLADIGTFLANPGASLSTIVEQQIAALTRQIDQAGILRGQLATLHRELDAGVEPDLAAWLTTLELMTMVDTYFSKEELKQLPFFAGDAACIAEWDAMVARFRQMIAAGTPPAAVEAQTLSQEWMLKMERDTNGDPDVMVRILAMQAREPAMRQQNGVTPEVEAYLKEAFAQSRLAMFKKYLSPEEFAFMDAHYRIRMDEWPGLIARVRKAIASGAAPADPQVRQLMREWIDLSQSFAGDDPATHAKVRVAYEKEPLLMIGSWITDEMKAYIGQAMAALHQHS